MNPATDLMTAEQLLYHHDAPGKRTELVGGRLVVREPAGYRHGSIGVRVLTSIIIWLQQDQKARGASHPLGELLLAETGFTLRRHPDTVRAPDVAFVRWERRPAATETGFAELAPDFVVEVLSPTDRPGEVLAKVADWLDAGTELVWVIDPERRIARVYRQDGSESTHDDAGTLDGEAVLPGFTLTLSTLFQIPN